MNRGGAGQSGWLGAWGVGLVAALRSWGEAEPSTEFREWEAELSRSRKEYGD